MAYFLLNPGCNIQFSVLLLPMNHRLPDMEALALQFTQFESARSTWSMAAPSQQDWEQQLQTRVMEIAEVPKAYLLEHASLREDLGLDSLDMVELVMLCEKDFCLDLQDHEWVRLRTYGQLQALFAEKITEKV